MSDRITRDVSGSSSDSEASGEPANVGEGHSPLGAVGQDRDVRSTESGCGRSSRSSLTSPGHDESRGLGARPRRKTEGKEGKGSKRHHHHAGKGVEWNKKDRRAARVHRGEGQKLAAERAAEAAAEEAARNARDAAEGRGRDKRDDGSGLIATRTKGPRTHHHHGHHHHGRRTEPKHGTIDSRMGRFGRLCSFLATSVTVGGPLAALACLVSILSSNTAGPVNNTQESASASGPVGEVNSRRQVAFMVVYILLSMFVLAVSCAHRFSNKDRKRKK
ncbi:hypothetical protein [Candidatus Ichthyocystis sparus]|uniref:hypothetical protein n=1 Tax=Candidatus Ichthyocystis sparus TaxID=1561004 RepID=UPI000B88B4CD|nr:hypothetical protein [Candidatus Ichthyocystis sparus]